MLIRRIEWFAAIATAVATVYAVVAIIFLPVATTGLYVRGQAPVIMSVYARDSGLGRMAITCAFVAVFGVSVVAGAWAHTRRASVLGSTFVLTGAFGSVLVSVYGTPLVGGYTQIPALLALVTAVLSIVPSRQRGVAK